MRADGTQFSFAVLNAFFRPLIGRRVGNSLPTAELYFTGPLDERIVLGHAIEPVGQYAFVAGRRGVLIRYASGREIIMLKNRRLEKLIYVIDDDLFAAGNDPFLPLDYRNRLTKFTSNVLPRILDVATEIVAPSRAILAAVHYNGHKQSLLDPAYLKLCSNFAHFRSPREVRCVILGTRSHRSDIASIASAVVAALAKTPKLTVATFLGHHAPPEFRNHARIRNRAPLTWQAFRHVLQTERYHIALAPALPTQFNRARSISRILDHASFGAAGIYMNQPPFSERILSGENGMLVEAEPRCWSEALVALANDLHKAEAIAVAGRNLAERLGDPARVRQFWSERLGSGAR